MSHQPTRRTFLKSTSAAAALTILYPNTHPALAQSPRLIPPDKGLTQPFIDSLFAKGAQKVYRGQELKTIAMPIGGLCAGQLYLAGDGRLAHFDIMNHTPDTGPGDRCYIPGRQPTFPLQQGFTIKTNNTSRTLDSQGFPAISMIGEYPLAWITYDDDSFPLKITQESFSPFIPLNAPDSALPATILRFEIENKTDKDLTATLTGHLENAVAQYSKNAHLGIRTNRVHSSPALTLLEMSVEPKLDDSTAVRAPEVFDDFENGYAKWTLTGAAFGTRPAPGTIPPQQPVTGYQGKSLVNSFNPNDHATGKMTSIEFTITRPFINFLIGGGADARKTSLNLVVDGQTVRTAAGQNSEHLDWQSFSVRPLLGKKAHFEIIDSAAGPWGHINLDQIEFADRPANATPFLTEASDFGTMTLACLGSAQAQDASADILEQLIGTLTAPLTLPARQKTTATFILAWHFPNHSDRGQYYATRFANSSDVAQYIAANFDRLRNDTHLWHDTYYDSTLPHWLLDRIHMPVANLATGTTQWWQSGRFWAWEGVGCCEGTCTHVWNYAQAMAHLFPELERSAREMQDFAAGFHDNGLVGFRGKDAYAADGQAGTILKAYREHLMSPDDAFLRRNYPHIKRAMQFLIGHDASAPAFAGQPPPTFADSAPKPVSAPDGIIEDPQHNTYDIWFQGANTFVGALYLASLRAAEQMATLMNDPEFAAQCHRLFDAGSRWTDAHLFDGEYYFQQVNLQEHPNHQYAHGCLSDQLFGQNWSNQLNLGPLYNPDHIHTALKSIYKYNWAPDLGPYNKAHPPGRSFALPGDPGLITCTFPKSDYLKTGVLYREEVWTGIEYQVASHMIQDGLLTEAFAILNGIHTRYDAQKHNPWNEIECGDHYARSLASWACLTALSGFQYNGPAGHLSFHPQLTPDNFKCPFTTAEGWGTYAQTKDSATLTLKHGTLRLTQFQVPLSAKQLTLNGQPITITTVPPDPRNQTTFLFDALDLKPGDVLQTA